MFPAATNSNGVHTPLPTETMISVRPSSPIPASSAAFPINTYLVQLSTEMFQLCITLQQQIIQRSHELQTQCTQRNIEILQTQMQLIQELQRENVLLKTELHLLKVEIQSCKSILTTSLNNMPFSSPQGRSSPLSPTIEPSKTVSFTTQMVFPILQEKGSH